jgi:hypothetical protein
MLEDLGNYIEDINPTNQISPMNKERNIRNPRDNAPNDAARGHALPSLSNIMMCDVPTNGESRHLMHTDLVQVLVSIIKMLESRMYS